MGEGYIWPSYVGCMVPWVVLCSIRSELGCIGETFDLFHSYWGFFTQRLTLVLFYD